MAAQPYASAAQSAPATYSAIPQQASANAAGASSGSAYAANANTAGANTGSAAGAGNGNNGVLSGTTYQSSGATSPLTPYNTVSIALQQLGLFVKACSWLTGCNGNLQKEPVWCI